MPLIERLLRPDDGTVTALLALVTLYAIVGVWMGRVARKSVKRPP